MSGDIFLPWGLFLLLPGFLLLRRPLARLFKLAFRTGLGFLWLFLFSSCRPFLGFGLGVNLFNALVLGALGIPGFGLLLMLQWLLL